MDVAKSLTRIVNLKVVGAEIVLTILAGVTSLWLLVSPDGKLLREQMAGEAPPAKVEAYVSAIARGDEAAALSLWELPSLRDQAQLSALADRRNQVTTALLIARPRAAYTIERIEWWGTCCEPRVITSARDAGGARMRVQLSDAQDLTLVYTFDVFVLDLPYGGAALDYPLRRWVIRDVYVEGQAPIFWQFAGAAASSP